MGVMVMAAYIPKANKEPDLREALRQHVPALRRQGLVTSRPAIHLRSRRDGTYLELFEWVDEESSKRAHDDPKVQEVWKALEVSSDMKPIGSLEEAGKLFAHFDVDDELGAPP
jgi:hypothetical protein